MNGKLSSLYFISQETPNYSHLELLDIVTQYGVKLVQLRLKDIPLNEVYDTAEKAKFICKRNGAILILNDYLQVASDLDLDGVHLGKEDASHVDARKLLGKNKIIGRTANSLDDVLALETEHIDYIGLGPFSFTTTKKNLSPILGLDGYRKIAKSRKTKIPIYAIGGITLKDILPLSKIVEGIAVSGLLANAPNIPATIQTIQNILD